MRVTVAIPTLKPRGDLPPLLKALRSQRAPFEIEILIADSGSPPWELGILGFYDARLLKIPPGTFDHGGTRNRLVQEATGDVVAFLTQDALPQGQGYLRELVGSLIAAPRAEAAYARQIPRPDADRWIKRRLAKAFPPGDRPIPQVAPPGGLSSLSPLERYALCRYDHVASAAWRRTLLRMALPRAPFGEDILWAKAILEGGGEVLYVPGAVVMHSHSRGPRETFHRTREEHRALKEAFGVQTVPNLQSLARGAASILLAPGEGRSDLDQRLRALAELGGQFMGPR